jgi:hypothetical protein
VPNRRATPITPGSESRGAERSRRPAGETIRLLRCRHRAFCDDPPCRPSRCPPTCGWMQPLSVMTTAREQPGDEGIRIPHFAGPLFVTAPCRGRKRRHQLKQLLRSGFSALTRRGLATAWDRSGMTPLRQRRTSYRKNFERPSQVSPTEPAQTTPRSGSLLPQTGAISMTYW